MIYIVTYIYTILKSYLTVTFVEQGQAKYVIYNVT